MQKSNEIRMAFCVQPLQWGHNKKGSPRLKRIVFLANVGESLPCFPIVSMYSLPWLLPINFKTMGPVWLGGKGESVSGIGKDRDGGLKEARVVTSWVTARSWAREKKSRSRRFEAHPSVTEDSGTLFAFSRHSQKLSSTASALTGTQQGPAVRSFPLRSCSLTPSSPPPPHPPASTTFLLAAYPA